MRMHRFALLAALWLSVVPVHGEPRENRHSTGSLHDAHGLHLTDIARAKGRYNADRTRFAVSNRVQVTNDQGNVAVLQDDGSVITQPNRFDLAGRSLAFTVAGNRYAVTSATGAFDTGSGSTTTLPLTDDSTAQVPLPFPFPFYGTSYQSVFVNSDGNLTFVTGDTDSSDRNLARVVTGPPRIAPLLNDLNPISPGAVTVDRLSDRVLVNWTNIGEWAPSGSSGQNTFQIVLERTGTIRFNYRTLTATTGVVAIGPGAGGPPTINLIDLSAAGGSPLYDGLVGEVFAAQADVDLEQVGRSFYETHQDAYDGLILFTDFTLDLGDAFAFALPVRNDVQGIISGRRPLYDGGQAFGSRQRMQVMVQMGALSNYPTDPQRKFLGENNTLSVLGQEFGHRWLAFMDTPTPLLLGRDESHWSFLHNSLGSVMEGNEIEDRGGGNFRTIGAVNRFSPLDQYVMGLRSAAEVPPWFVITNPAIVQTPPNFPNACRNLAILPECGPLVGVDLTGTRRDVTIQEVIQAMGPRIPSSDTAPKQFRVAFILLTERGRAPRATSVQQVDLIRQQWEQFFNSAVDNRGSMQTNLLYLPPQITSVTPSVGVAGSVISVRGAGFQPNTVVSIGGVQATTTFRSSTLLDVTVPPSGVAGSVAVVVRNPADGQTATLAAGFTYAAPTVIESLGTLPPNGSQRIETAGPDATVRAGYATLDGSYGVAVFRTLSGSDVVSEAAIPASTTSNVFTLYAERTTNLSTGVAIVNTGATPSTITLLLNDGRRTTLSLGAGAHTARFIHELFPSVGTAFLGTLTIQSSSPVAAVALRGTVNDLGQFIMTTVPVSSGALLGGTVVFPQIAEGGGYVTELILVNPSPTTLRGTVDFSFNVESDRGSGTRFAYEILPGNVWRLKSSGTPAAVQTGFATLTPGQGSAPAATAVIAYSIGGVLKSEAGVSAQTPLSRAVLFGTRSVARRSVVAMVNREASAAQIRMTAYNLNGSLALPTQTLTLAAGAYQAAFFDELLPSLPNNFEGIFTVESSVPVAFLTLRGGFNSAGEFLMTTMPLIDPSQAPPTPIYFPHLADGGGYTTEFLLLRATGAYRLRFFASSGQPLPVSLR